MFCLTSSPFWKRLPVKFAFLERWSQQIARIRDRRFLEAAMAAAALVSTADHDTRLSEQIALDHLLERLEKLRIFHPHRAVDLHRRFAEAIEADPEAGRQKAVAAVSAFKGKGNDALLILFVAASIARANFAPQAEREVLRELQDHLDLPPESFDRIWKATRTQMPVAQSPPGAASSSAHG